MRFSGTPVEYKLPPPRLGEHTREVLGSLLGLADGELDRLAAQKII
jgi:crotonobetainyl-CoA:carnitine CoA-transferase CaiB-like acyl-CoA transferase